MSENKTSQYLKYAIGEIFLVAGDAPRPLGDLDDSLQALEAIVALDLNLINNSRTVSYQKQGTLFLSGVVHFWTQNFLNGWAFFN